MLETLSALGAGSFLLSALVHYYSFRTAGLEFFAIASVEDIVLDGLKMLAMALLLLIIFALIGILLILTGVLRWADRSLTKGKGSAILVILAAGFVTYVGYRTIEETDPVLVTWFIVRAWGIILILFAIGKILWDERRYRRRGLTLGGRLSLSFRVHSRSVRVTQGVFSWTMGAVILFAAGLSLTAIDTQLVVGSGTLVSSGSATFDQQCPKATLLWPGTANLVVRCGTGGKRFIVRRQDGTIIATKDEVREKSEPDMIDWILKRSSDLVGWARLRAGMGGQ